MQCSSALKYEELFEIPAVHNYDGCAQVWVAVEAVNLCVCVRCV